MAAACAIVFMATEGAGYGPGYAKGPVDGAWVGLVCAVPLVIGCGMGDDRYLRGR